MKNSLGMVGGLILALLTAAPVYAKTEVGEPAPDFKLVDANGQTQSVSQYKGKIVVLEWNNPECPFVKKHYGSGNMQKQQEEAKAKGVVWLTVNSGAKGKQGALDAAGAKAFVADQKAQPAAYVLDGDGTAGRLYGARTTPHMYVIDAGGKLAYMGGIDSIQSADPSDIPKATQYVTKAIGELAAGKPVSEPKSAPYGCSVKY